MPDADLTGRRPLKSRNLAVFQRLAAGLARSGVSPNAISFSSMVFAGGAGLAFAATAHLEGGSQRVCWLAAAALIQLRLLANMLDGMVAVEGGKGGPTGDLWNEAPDRVADALIFIGAGFAAGSSPLLGLGAALMAVFVAYVRALGASLGAGQLFQGPMAKPHRMFALTVLGIWGALFPQAVGVSPLSLSDAATELYLQDTYYVVSEVTLDLRAPATVVLGLSVVGCAITAVRRLSRISAFLKSKPRP